MKYLVVSLVLLVSLASYSSDSAEESANKNSVLREPSSSVEKRARSQIQIIPLEVQESSGTSDNTPSTEPYSGGEAIGPQD